MHKLGNEVATALAKAKEQGWDSMQKGIEGGIKFIREEYLDAHQNTLYLNKFDVNPNSPGGFYSHQYMQNLSAAYSEAHTFRDSYVDTGTLDNTIKFIIPVYENMPETVSARPAGDTTTLDVGPINVQVTQTDMELALRSEPSTQGGESTVKRRLPTGTIILSIERLTGGWHRVITSDGTEGYCSDSYLEIIDDVKNCNERVAISTSDVNVRIGPGMSFLSLGTFNEGTTGTRILKGAYSANGHVWDLVILDNGTKGFIASDYLRII